MNLGELFDLRDILWHVFNTTILFLGLRFLLYRPVRRFMDARAKRIKDQQEVAQALLEAAKQHELKAQEMVQQTAHKAAKIVSDSTLQAKAQAGDIVLSAEQKAQEIVERAYMDARNIQQKNKEAMQEQAVSLAVEISQQLLKREISLADHKEIIKDLLKKVN